MLVLTYPRKTLKANLGKEGPIWATETIGYDVTAWITEPDGRQVPQYTRFAKTVKEAANIKAGFLKR